VVEEMGDEHPTGANNLSDALWAQHESGVVALRKHLHATGKLGWRQPRTTRQVIGLPEPLRFGIVDIYSTDYFKEYRSELDDSYLTDEECYWFWELANYDITLSEDAHSEVVQEGGEDSEGRVWRIVDGARTYEVKVEAGVMNLYLPPFDDQLASRLQRAMDELHPRRAPRTRAPAAQS
jgi:hypothetical protein